MEITREKNIVGMTLTATEKTDGKLRTFITICNAVSYVSGHAVRADFIIDALFSVYSDFYMINRYKMKMSHITSIKATRWTRSDAITLYIYCVDMREYTAFICDPQGIR